MYQVKTLNRWIIVALMLIASACGGADSGGENEIERVTLRDKTTPPGGTNSVRVNFQVAWHVVDFNSDGEDIRESDSLTLVVLLPNDTYYVDGSSKLTDSIFGDTLFGNPDKRSPNRVGRCPTGIAYLAYDFRSGAFDDPTALDSADLFLKFDLLIDPPANGKRVQAGTAQYKISDPCDVLVEGGAQIIVAE